MTHSTEKGDGETSDFDRVQLQDYRCLPMQDYRAAEVTCQQEGRWGDKGLVQLRDYCCAPMRRGWQWLKRERDKRERENKKHCMCLVVCTRSFRLATVTLSSKLAMVLSPGPSVNLVRNGQNATDLSSWRLHPDKLPQAGRCWSALHSYPGDVHVPTPPLPSPCIVPPCASRIWWFVSRARPPSQPSDHLPLPHMPTRQVFRSKL